MLILPGGIPVATPTPIDLTAATLQNGGDWPNGGGGAKLHDGTTSYSVAAGARSANSGDVWVKFQLPAGADVTEVKAYGPNNGPMHETNSSDIKLTVYYSTTGAWSGEEVQIGEIASFDGSASAAVATITCSGSSGKPGYMALRFRQSFTDNKFACAEIEATGVQ